MHRVGEEPAGDPGDRRHRWHNLKQLLGRLSVCREVILTAQPVIPYPGGISHAGIEIRQLVSTWCDPVPRPLLRHDGVPFAALPIASLGLEDRPQSHRPRSATRRPEVTALTRAL